MKGSTQTPAPMAEEFSALAAISDLEERAKRAAMDAYDAVIRQRQPRGEKLDSEFAAKCGKTHEALCRAQEKERGSFLAQLPAALAAGVTTEELKVRVAAESRRLAVELEAIENERDAALAALKGEVVNAAAEAAAKVVSGFEEERRQLVIQFNEAQLAAIHRRGAERVAAMTESDEDFVERNLTLSRVLLAVGRQQLATAYATINMARHADAIAEEVRGHIPSDLYFGSDPWQWDCFRAVEALLPKGSEMASSAALAPPVPIFRLPSPESHG